jgi:threonine dehydratase
MITIEAIEEAANSIRDHIFHTQLVYSPSFSRMFGGEIYLKLENLQRTGAFKIRGAAYKLNKRMSEIGPKGVVAASAGNHAQGVALAAREAGIGSTIVMPAWASLSKQEATRGYGGKVVLAGDSIGESLAHAKKLAEEGMTFIHPFDDPDIIAGQGTIALEILEELPDADMILVPIGGGGLISGISCAAKSLRPKIRIVGVEPAVCPSARQSWIQGSPVSVEADVSIADGVSVKKIGGLNYGMIAEYVDDIALAEEEHIASAILMLLERKKVLAEGAGALPLAVLLNRSVAVPPGKKAVLVISGGNVDSPLLGRIISKGLIKNGRTMRFRVWLSDKPGSLSRLLERIAALEANVLHIYHDRNIADLPITVSCVELELETRSQAHIDLIYDDLKKAGYVPEPK